MKSIARRPRIVRFVLSLTLLASAAQQAAAQSRPATAAPASTTRASTTRASTAPASTAPAMTATTQHLTFHVDRAFDRSAGAGSDISRLPESSYRATPRHEWDVQITGPRIEVGQGGSVRYRGEYTGQRDGAAIYMLTEGTVGGGEFVIHGSGLVRDAELTLSGSGVPVLFSFRGTIAPHP